MVKVLKGESDHQHWWRSGPKQGQIVRGIVDKDDTGLCQINKRHWDKQAKRLGLDYENSITDNLKMCRYIYDTQGITAWVYYNDHLSMR